MAHERDQVEQGSSDTHEFTGPFNNEHIAEFLKGISLDEVLADVTRPSNERISPQILMRVIGMQTNPNHTQHTGANSEKQNGKEPVTATHALLSAYELRKLVTDHVGHTPHGTLTDTEKTEIWRKLTEQAMEQVRQIEESYTQDATKTLIIQSAPKPADKATQFLNHRFGPPPQVNSQPNKSMRN